MDIYGSSRDNIHPSSRLLDGHGPHGPQKKSLQVAKRRCTHLELGEGGDGVQADVPNVQVARAEIQVGEGGHAAHQGRHSDVGDAGAARQAQLRQRAQPRQLAHGCVRQALATGKLQAAQAA